MKRFVHMVLLAVALLLLPLPAGFMDKDQGRVSNLDRTTIALEAGKAFQEMPPLKFERFTSKPATPERIPRIREQVPYYIPRYIRTLQPQYSSGISMSRDHSRSPEDIRADAPQTGKRARIDGLRMFMIDFDNDIYNNTDYYYTNGIRFRLIHPFISQIPTGRMLLPDLNYSTSYYGVELVQNMYTPIDPDQPEIQSGDRPFASYLYLGFFRTQIQPITRVRLNSSLQLGILGPGALGAQVQSTIHDINPVGWKNQVTNDVVINYNIDIEKALLEGNNWFVSGMAGARLGTLYTDFQGGARIRAGNGYRHFELLSPLQMIDHRIKWFIEGTFNTRLAIYDATLQGGMLHPTSIYTISDRDIQRLIFNASLGIGISWRFISLTMKQYYLTPEFKGGKKHMWGRISLDFRI